MSEGETSEKEEKKLEAKVEQLVGDLHAVSADYTDAMERNRLLIKALNQIQEEIKHILLRVGAA